MPPEIKTELKEFRPGVGECVRACAHTHTPILLLLRIGRKSTDWEAGETVTPVS